MKHDQTSCDLRPPLLGTTLVPSRLMSRGEIDEEMIKPVVSRDPHSLGAPFVPSRAVAARFLAELNQLDHRMTGITV